MKFKGVISHEGMRALERSFLPAIEKFGDKCHLLLTPDDIYLIQDVQEADGMQTSARLETSIIFEPGSLVCESLANNIIAFGITVPLLHKVFRAANAHDAEALNVKLANRAIPGAATQEAVRPMLIFKWQGDNVMLGQEMPVGPPYLDAALNQVKELCDVPQLCPFYLDILPELLRITATVDKLKSLCDTVTMSLTRQGDFHLVVQGTGVALGEGFPGLDVLPAPVALAASELQSERLEARLREAEMNGEAVTVGLHLAHLAKVLRSSPLTNPQRMLCGVAMGPDGEEGGAETGDQDQQGRYVQIVFVYESHMMGELNDSSMQLFYKLPVREEL